jgi:D-erythrulose 1-phosphate 3-epimerase
MTTYRLGINTSFAVKRWPQPERWARLVRDELGLDLVQHSLDLVDLDASPADIHDQASWLRAACAAGGLTLHSTCTGMAAYAGNLLLHPDRSGRERAWNWFRRAIDFTADVGGVSTGGYLGAYGLDDWHHPVRRRRLWDELGDWLNDLAGHARSRGLGSLMAENSAAAREPCTLTMLSSLLTDGDEAHVPIMLCIDVGNQCTAGTIDPDRDPYAWLELLGSHAPVVQLTQTDGSAGHQWPFTAEANEAGMIEARRVLETLDRSGATEVALILEIAPSLEQDDDQVRKNLRQSVEYWRAGLREHLA